LPFNLNLDTANNMSTVETAINARNSSTYFKQSNGVHPALTGYWQMADSVFMFLKGAE